MKRKLRYSLALAMVFTLVSCFEQPVTTTPTTTTGGGGFGTGDTGGTNDGGGNTNDDGGGGTNGNGGPGYPPLSWEISYAGGVNWYPRNNPESNAYYCNASGYNTYTTSECYSANSAILSETTPTTLDARTAFQTDSRYKVKITVKPFSFVGGTAGGNNSTLKDKLHCYRRLVPGATQSHDNYSGLRFTVKLRKLTNCNSSGCSLGSTVSTVTKDVAVNSSTIIDFSGSRPPSAEPYFVEISNVKNLSYLDSNGNPRSIRSFSCWDMKVEVATDYTQDF